MVRLNLSPFSAPIFPLPPKGGAGENGPMAAHFGEKRGKTGNTTLKRNGRSKHA